jgi:hypothetical protein
MKSIFKNKNLSIKQSFAKITLLQKNAFILFKLNRCKMVDFFYFRVCQMQPNRAWHDKRSPGTAQAKPTNFLKINFTFSEKECIIQILL